MRDETSLTASSGPFTGEDQLKAVVESAGRYMVLGEHGKGGMGRVLIVRDEHLERDIALKELLPDIDEGSTPTPVRHSKAMVGRFLREARITGQLEHPSITPVHELGCREDGTLYYTMKLVRGKTLSQAIKEAGTLEKRLKLLPHFVDLCQAIAYAHSRGVIHRDIKPSNVMVGDYGETVIIDWGLAKVKGRKDVNADVAQSTILAMRSGSKGGGDVKTEYGQALGTPVYMPPEQAKGYLEVVDERSDVYSLGAVLYQILTGQPPFSGSSSHEVLHKVCEETPPDVRDLEKRAPGELVAICGQAMSAKREERFSSAQELADRVSGYSRFLFSLNPFRPYVWELVPEMASFSAQDKTRVIRSAKRRMKRKNPGLYWRHVFKFWGLAAFMLAMAYYLIVVAISVVAGTGGVEQLSLDKSNLERAVNNYRVEKGLTDLKTRPSHDIEAWRQYKHYAACFLAVTCGFYVLNAYLFVRFMTGLNPTIVPWIKEELARGGWRT